MRHDPIFEIETGVREKPQRQDPSGLRVIWLHGRVVHERECEDLRLARLLAKVSECLARAS